MEWIEWMERMDLVAADGRAVDEVSGMGGQRYDYVAGELVE